MGDIEWRIFAYIVAQIETPLVAAVINVTNTFLRFVATPLKVSLVLYITLTGISMLQSHTNETASDLIGRFMKLVLVVWVILGAGVYQQLVYDFFFVTLPSGLTTALTSSGSVGTVSAASFDQVWIKAWRGGLEVWRTLDFGDIAEKLVIVVFWACAIVSTVFCFCVWLMSRVVLALYIAIGPLLIGLVLFPATRAIFERWIGSLISCVILQVTTVVLLFIVLAVERNVVGRVAEIGLVDPMALIQVLLAGTIFFAVAAFIGLQLPGVAALLSGGLQFHAGGVMRAMRETVGTTGKTQTDAQGNKQRVGRSGALGLMHVGGSLVGRGAALAGRGAVAAGHGVQRLRNPPGGSLSDQSTKPS